MNIVEVIKKLCIAKNITLQELAEKLGIGVNSIYRWNTHKPSTDKLEKVADYFDVSVDYLLGRETSSGEDEYDDLVMMFRKSEQEVPEAKRDQYRREIQRFMEFVKEDMKKDN